MILIVIGADIVIAINGSAIAIYANRWHRRRCRRRRDRDGRRRVIETAAACAAHVERREVRVIVAAAPIWMVIGAHVIKVIDAVIRICIHGYASSIRAATVTTAAYAAHVIR